ncbi:DUF4153 domain-containing protein [Gemmatimonadota bacterium]
MHATLPDKVKTRLVLAAVGLVQGFVYYLAHEFWPDTNTPRALVAAALFFTTGLALTNLLAWTGKDIKRLLLVGSVAPLVFALAAIWVWLQIPTGDVPYRDDSVRLPTSIFSAILSLSILLPGIQVFQATGGRSFPYAELFRRYWDNIFVLMTAGFVMGAFWIVILLWSELFKLIDVTVFDDVFTHAAFVCMGLSGVFSYGVALGREWEKITATIRSILFTVLKALMPLLAVIALLFLVSLPFTGLQPLWDTRHASATLLSLIALTILFFNGAFLDGTEAPPYSRWIRHLVEASLVAIPVYAVITFYALYLRIGQYGLTFGRFYGVLFALGGMSCGLGYAVSVFRRRGQWMETARLVNIGMGLVVVVCAVLVHTPVLDPLRWSARSQFNRLAGGEVDAAEFDYGYLRFQLGHIGFETLAALEGLTDHPQANVIRDRVQATRDADSYADVRPQPASLVSASDILPLDASTALPDSLVSFVVTRLTQYQADECEANGDCTMFAANLDSDSDPEYVLVLSGDESYQILAYDRDENGNWRQVGRLRPYENDARLPLRAELLDTLRLMRPTSEVPQYRDLVIGGLKLRVMY